MATELLAGITGTLGHRDAVGKSILVNVRFSGTELAYSLGYTDGVLSLIHLLVFGFIPVPVVELGAHEKVTRGCGFQS